MFLLRTAFWLSLVILLLPTGQHAGEDADTAQNPGVTASDAFDVARSAYSDLSGFCDRNPQTCETGSAALRTFGQKAQYGARMVYEYLAEFDTAGQPARAAAPDGGGAENTLTAEDLAEPWRGPEDVRG